MAGWYHQHDKTRSAAHKLRTALPRKQASPAGLEPRCASGLEEERLLLVASYIGVYPTDEAERISAKRALAERPRSEIATA
jgi:hypothetical protein